MHVEFGLLLSYCFLMFDGIIKVQFVAIVIYVYAFLDIVGFKDMPALTDFLEKYPCKAKGFCGVMGVVVYNNIPRGGKTLPEKIRYTIRLSGEAPDVRKLFPSNEDKRYPHEFPGSEYSSLFHTMC